MPPSRKRVLVLGAYGLIGFGVTRHLLHCGHQVSGLGRDADTARRVFLHLNWTIRDMATLRRKTDWRALLNGVDVVVNCSGALQDGPADDLEAVHHLAIAALAAACAETGTHLIQISAVGAEVNAPTAFMASKGRGDAAVQASGARHHILRPGLVLAAHSYGGTALLRMLAAIPVVQPIALPDTQIQTVALEDVARCVGHAIDGDVPDSAIVDLVEAHPHQLREVLAATRQWLGFTPARREIALPAALTRMTSACADALSHMGWRSPLRRTAMQVLEDGVIAPPPDLGRHGLPALRSMDETFADLPATVEARLHARMLLLMPMMIAGLCLFWLLSGVIGIARAPQAAAVLEQAGWPAALSMTSVMFWAVVDIVIGLGFAVRRFAKRACWGAVVVSVFYLLAATVVTPALWLDPLGPLLKIIPGALLALVARAALDTR